MVWNAGGQTLYWGKRTAARLCTTPKLPLSKRDDQVTFFYEFLRGRLDHHGKPLTRFLAAPAFFEKQWIRFPWIPGQEDGSSLLTEEEGGTELGMARKWRRFIPRFAMAPY